MELVEFHGYNHGMTRQKIIIQFVVDYRLHEIEPYSLTVNGEPQGEKEFLKMMEDVFRTQDLFELDDGLQKDEKRNVIRNECKSRWSSFYIHFFFYFRKEKYLK